VECQHNIPDASGGVAVHCVSAEHPARLCLKVKGLGNPGQVHAGTTDGWRSGERRPFIDVIGSTAGITEMNGSSVDAAADSSTDHTGISGAILVSGRS
jgi:hypothetical protein